jgi:hypothetical protein
MMAVEPLEAPANPATSSPALKVGKVTRNTSNELGKTGPDSGGPDSGATMDGITLAHIFDNSGHAGPPLSRLTILGSIHAT